MLFPRYCVRCKESSKNEIVASVIIACFVSGFFYYVYGNSGVVRSRLDMIWFNFGVLLPFLLPVFVIIDKRLEGKKYG